MIKSGLIPSYLAASQITSVKTLSISMNALFVAFSIFAESSRTAVSMLGMISAVKRLSTNSNSP